MIAPTVGRIVWFYRSADMNLMRMDEQPMAAIIAYVFDARTVMLMVIDHGGQPTPLNVPVQLLQDDDTPPVAGHAYCTWMPYQKAVAAGAIAPTLHATEKKDA